MPTRTEIRQMTKPQLVDLACEVFEDTGHLRAEMNALTKSEIIDLLFDHDVPEEPQAEETVTPVVTTPPARTKTDLGSW
jgi:hypothetical protein